MKKVSKINPIWKVPSERRLELAKKFLSGEKFTWREAIDFTRCMVENARLRGETIKDTAARWYGKKWADKFFDLKNYDKRREHLIGAPSLKRVNEQIGRWKMELSNRPKPKF